MEVYGFEGDRAERELGKKNHSRNPEEENIVARLEKVGWVIGLQVHCVFGPAECRKGPETRREPCVECILVLSPSCFGWLDTHCNFFSSIPDGNAVSVPDLSADAPVAQIFYPVEIGLLKMFGDNFNSPRTHWLKHQLFERLATSGDFFVHLDEPLQFYLRLDNATRALGSGDVVDVRLLFGHEAFRVELLDDFRSGLGDFRPRQFS